MPRSRFSDSERLEIVTEAVEAITLDRLPPAEAIRRIARAHRCHAPTVRRIAQELGRDLDDASGLAASVREAAALRLAARAASAETVADAAKLAAAARAVAATDPNPAPRSHHALGERSPSRDAAQPPMSREEALARARELRDSIAARRRLSSTPPEPPKTAADFGKDQSGKPTPAPPATLRKPRSSRKKVDPMRTPASSWGNWAPADLP